MRKIFFLLACMITLQTSKVQAQITLEHTLDSVTTGGQFYCTNLGNNDFKYVFLDTAINGFHLYNMNMTLYMTVNIPVISNHTFKNGYTAVYITKALFDCDSSNIEFAYEKPSGSGGWPDRSFYVYRTDGTLLLKVDSANAPYCLGCYGGSHDIRPIQNTSSGTKLYIQKHNITYNTGIRIYSLCGSLPIEVYDFSHVQKFVKIYPNPTAESLNFECALPNNQEQFELLIFDGSAKEQKRLKVESAQTFSLDVSDYPSGAYFYSFSTKSRIYQTGKFLITK